MIRRPIALLVVWTVWLGWAAFASAQSGAKPWGRVSFFANSSQTQADGGVTSGFSEFTTTVAYQLPDVDESGADYGVDFRYSGYTATSRPRRIALYEGFVGGRFADGSVRVRAGHMWLNDLGALGSVAGGLFEYRQPRLVPEDGRIRVGVFAGLEPEILDTGYAPNVRKMGGYVAWDGDAARRHVVGFVTVRNASVTERSVLSVTNFLPVQNRFFIYQAAEYDVTPPAGQGHRGLAYLFANGRWVANDRVEVQGTYNRGRSIDTRTLSDDVLNGRPIAQTAVDGLLYESLGGRVTVEVVRHVRAYAGYARDKNNRDAQPGGRTLVGAYASNVAGSGFDLTASDSLMTRAGGSYHSRYVSAGRQIGRRTYVSGDFSTSLSVVTYSRSDGIMVALHPHLRRYSGTGTINVGRAASLLVTVERTRDDTSRDLRLFSGITYRFR